ncbi:MAG: hypothetical protein RBS73_11810 [Prolixibacteraceae bacterium]|jgi:spermidine synthase|nr:hypothetical protein [Prolixibacteraceae bacterium]
MNTAYPLLPLTVLLIAFYAFSSVLSRLGIVSRANHRKFWNVLLLLTFLTAGLLGLLLVVKINYKLEIPFYDQLLKYHVEFGIAMALIGFIHFLWHLNYYLQLFRATQKPEPTTKPELINDTRPAFLKTSAFLLGSASMIAQVVLLREFLTVFNGNELAIGIALANWMVLTGLGAWLGLFRLNVKKTSEVIVPGLLLLSALPFVTAFLVNFLKNIVFPIGAMIGVFQMLFSSFLLLLPFCLVSGFLFTFLANCSSESSKQNQTGPMYGFESLGSVAGGLLSGAVFIFLFSSIESLLALVVLNGGALLLVQKKARWMPSIVIVLAFTALFFSPGKRIRSFVYPNQQVTVSKDSPFGNIVVTQRENQVSVYHNNTLLFDSENFMLNEETVHFAMLQHPDPKKILLVSGDPMGELTELQKYSPETIHYLEENRWMLHLLNNSLEKISDPRIKIFSGDPLRYLRSTNEKYDVIILNLPPPATLQSNRFYTEEFFRMTKTKLGAGGILSFGLPASANYQGSEAVQLNSALVASLKTAFRNVIILPGEKNHFLASEAELTYNIAKAIENRGIETLYVNPFYIDDMLLKNRGKILLSNLDPAAETNQNLKPLAYRQQLAYWLSYFPGQYELMSAVLVVFALFLFFRGSLASKAMIVTGFSASGLEILLLFGLQLFFGTIYLLTSFVFAGFMAGLAAGAFFGKRFSPASAKKQILHNQLLMAGFSILLLLLLFISGQSKIAPVLIYTLCFLLILLLGGLTGLQFTLASLLQKGSYSEISGKTYSSDLIGSALGALAVSLFFVPRWGILPATATIGAINLVFGFLVTFKEKYTSWQKAVK